MSAWRSSNSSKSSPSLAMERGSDGGREGGQEEGKTGGIGGILCKNKHTLNTVPLYYLNPTAVTEEVGLSDPVNVSLITSGGCLARLNMVARTARGKQQEGISMSSHLQLCC